LSGLILYRDAVYYLHEHPWGYHLEGPWRLVRAYDGIVRAGLAVFFVESAAPPWSGVEGELLKVHDASYVGLVRRLSLRGGGLLDADTYVNEYSFDAGLAVVSAVLDASERLVSGSSRLALVLGRPPGHHAGRYGAAMGAPTLGFCIFNAAALAAKRIADMGLRVAVVDFDLHHGNGTQEILYSDPRILHVDFHQDPSTIYPGTGWPWQNGEGDAEATKINVLLPPGAGDDLYTYIASAVLEAVWEAHGVPDVLVVDAGFDGHRGDGLGALELTANTYRLLGRLLRESSHKHLVVLEGGYNTGLEEALPAFIAELAALPSRTVLDDETRTPREVWERGLRALKETCRYNDLRC